MTSANIKVKIRVGRHRFEAEGPRTDVEALLERWWRPTEENNDGSEKTEDARKAPKKAAKTARANTTKAAAGNSISKDTDSQFDQTQLANKLKNDPQIETITEKIIEVKRDLYHKVLFVLWYADEPLTSGQIQRFLTAISVKVDPAAVSRCLSDNSSKFILSAARSQGGQPAQYSLSAPTKKEFEQWLGESEE